MTRPNILVYGYGNPGRGDDGAGIAFAEKVSESFDWVSVETNYQLNAEDALAVAQADAVIFVDASKRVEGIFGFCRLIPSVSIGFSTHAMSPESVVGLCSQLYGKEPGCYLLEIAGYDWEAGETLSPGTRKGIEKAFEFLQPLLNSENGLRDLALAANSSQNAQDGRCFHQLQERPSL